MRNKEPLKEILIATRPHWDHPQTRLAVRENFLKSDRMPNGHFGSGGPSPHRRRRRLSITHANRELAPSCGYRATLLWLREQWNALPDIPYTGIVFTNAR